MKGIGLVAVAAHIMTVDRVLNLGVALPALADSDPNTCRGVDFDAKRPLPGSDAARRGLVAGGRHKGHLHWPLPPRVNTTSTKDRALGWPK
jgi:hypothetical protein